MKKKLLSWDKAVEEAKKRGARCYRGNLIYGLDKNSIKWGEEVDAYTPIPTYREVPETYYYMVKNFSVPNWVFEDDDDFQSIVLKDGILIKNELLYNGCFESAPFVNIRILGYGGKLYWYKEVNGEVEEFEELERL